MKTKKLILSLFALLSFSFAACSGATVDPSSSGSTSSGGGTSDSSGGGGGTVIPVSSVSLNRNALEIIVGQTGNLTATVAPNNATNKNVTWASDAENIATVLNGTVSAVAIGTANITVASVADPTKTATCAITVVPEPDYSVTYHGTLSNGIMENVVYAHAFGVSGAETVKCTVDSTDKTKVTFTTSKPYEGLIIAELKPGEETINESWSNVAKKTLNLNAASLTPAAFNFELRECVTPAESPADFVVWGTNGHNEGTEWGKMADITSESANVYRATVRVYPQSTIAFHIEGETWLGYDNFTNTPTKLKFARASTESNDAVSQVSEEIEFIIHTDTNTIEVGGEIPAAATYYLVGDHNNWGQQDVGKTLTVHPSDFNVYSSDVIAFDAEDKIKVNDGAGESANWFSNESTWEGCGFDIDEQGNVVILEAGNYVVNFYVAGTNNNHITIDRQYSFTCRGLPLTRNALANLLPGQTGEYTINSFAVAADEEITFEKDGVKITEKIGPDGPNTENQKLNNAYVNADDGKFYTRASSGSEAVTVYFKTWQDGGYSFFVTHGPSYTAGYQLFLNGSPVSGVMSEVPESEWPDGVIGEYKMSINGVVGQTISFAKNMVDLDAGHVNKDDGAGNNVDSSLKIGLSGQSDVYLKLYAGSGEHAAETYYTVWASTPSINLATVKYSVNGGTAVTAVDVKETESPNLAEYVIELNKDDVITLFNGVNFPFGFYEWNETELRVELKGTTYTAKEDGEYTFYLNENYQVFVGAPVHISKYYAVVGTVAPVEIVEDKVSAKPTGVLNQYKIEVSGAAGTEIKIYEDEAHLTEHIGVDQLYNNNVKVEEGKIKIVCDCANATLYLKKYNDGYSVWLEGYDYKTVPHDEQYYLTVKRGADTYYYQVNWTRNDEGNAKTCFGINELALQEGDVLGMHHAKDSGYNWGGLALWGDTTHLELFESGDVDGKKVRVKSGGAGSYDIELQNSYTDNDPIGHRTNDWYWYIIQTPAA